MKEKEKMPLRSMLQVKTDFYYKNEFSNKYAAFLKQPYRVQEISQSCIKSRDRFFLRKKSICNPFCKRTYRTT